jgi:hypothetical protein
MDSALRHFFRKRDMSRSEIIEKVANDLWLTLEKRDGIFVFRFPDVWDIDDILEMKKRVLDGIAMLEARYRRGKKRTAIKETLKSSNCYDDMPIAIYPAMYSENVSE